MFLFTEIKGNPGMRKLINAEQEFMSLLDILFIAFIWLNKSTGGILYERCS